MAQIKQDTSAWGRFRDALAHKIMEFTMKHIATKWYAAMISGSIRLGMQTAATQNDEKKDE